jgi:histidine ammonia-lyase
LLYSNLHELINLEEAENILHGQCILATTLCLMIKQSERFMRQAEIGFALSFLALRGKNDAFLPQVH